MVSVGKLLSLQIGGWVSLGFHLLRSPEIQPDAMLIEIVSRDNASVGTEPYMHSNALVLSQVHNRVVILPQLVNPNLSRFLALMRSLELRMTAAGDNLCG